MAQIEIQGSTLNWIGGLDKISKNNIDQEFQYNGTTSKYLWPNLMHETDAD